MKRQMKNVPAKSCKKLFSMNISNFLMRSMLFFCTTFQPTKVAQKMQSIGMF